MSTMEYYARRYFVLLNAINDSLEMLERNQPEKAKELLCQIFTDMDKAYLRAIHIEK